MRKIVADVERDRDQPSMIVRSPADLALRVGNEMLLVQNGQLRKELRQIRQTLKELGTQPSLASLTHPLARPEKQAGSEPNATLAEIDEAQREVLKSDMNLAS